jgi:uncharacterized protein YdeI (YjbR/CyaY-like superfamily)
VAARPLRFRDPAEWRRWLAAHHASETEALVFISKKATPGGIHYEEALEEALCFGWIDGKLRSHDAGRFILRFSPRKKDSVWSESNRTRALRLIAERRIAAPGLARIEEAKISGAWDHTLRPSRKPPMPRDLREPLRADPNAWTHFRGWGDSFQAMSIRWVDDVKRAETRERRIRRVVQRATEDPRPGIEGF